MQRRKWAKDNVGESFIAAVKEEGRGGKRRRGCQKNKKPKKQRREPVVTCGPGQRDGVSLNVGGEKEGLVQRDLNPRRKRRKEDEKSKKKGGAEPAHNEMF